MSDPRPKLPRSIWVLNIIMIVLILVICALAFSLAYSTIKGDSDTDDAQSAEAISETAETWESGDAPEPAVTTTTRVSVTMTKRTTEPTEPIEPVTAPTEEITAPDNPETTDIVFEEPSTVYSKEFFADDLFIGDSISTGLYLYSKLDMKNVAAGIGYTPYKAYSEPLDLYDGSSATALEYATSMQPKRIFVMLGSNGMGSAADIEAMKGTYRTLIDKLSAGCPSSEIYCISVTPVTADSSSAASSGITNEMIRDFNSYVEGMCAELGIRYFDLYSLLLDGSGYFSKDYAEVDGLHFLGKTYDVMLSYIQNELS